MEGILNEMTIIELLKVKKSLCVSLYLDTRKATKKDDKINIERLRIVKEYIEEMIEGQYTILHFLDDGDYNYSGRILDKTEFDEIINNQ